MKKVSLVFGGAPPVEFELADDSSKPVVFVLGVRKSGSSLLNSICGALAGANGWHFCDVAGTLFDANVRENAWRSQPVIQRLLVPGNVLGGFRSMPIGMAGALAFQEVKKVLMVRDPRDALVSEYFSNAFSHSLPASGAAGPMSKFMLKEREKALASSVSEYVIQRAPSFAHTLEELKPVVTDPNAVMFRYEDYIFKKRQLITEIVQHFGWACDDALMTSILGWADVVPSEERPREFVRRVTPGDYAEKLDAATIAKVNEQLAGVMGAFGY